MKSYKERLGRAGWNFLHTMAEGWYNNNFQSKNNDMQKFWKYLGKVYPCEHCSNHINEYIRAKPVRGETNASYRRWLCQFHNAVNARLGKPITACEFK